MRLAFATSAPLWDRLKSDHAATAMTQMVSAFISREIFFIVIFLPLKVKIVKDNVLQAAKEMVFLSSKNTIRFLTYKSSHNLIVSSIVLAQVKYVSLISPTAYYITSIRLCYFQQIQSHGKNLRKKLKPIAESYLKLSKTGRDV